MARGNHGNLAYADAEHVSHADVSDLRTAPVEVITPPRRVIYPISDLIGGTAAAVHEIEVEESTPEQSNDAVGQAAGTKVILPFEKQGEYFVEPLGEVKAKPVYDFIKRALDILVSAVGLVVLVIPMLVLAIVIKCSSKGTVFYQQERLGLNGKKINIIKYRTMRMDAEANGAQWSQGDEDPRIFPLGMKLRKLRIDELPQLWCILKGDMSLVGPRPERECFYDEFETYVHGFHERLKVKPGLTGLAQVNGGYDLRPEEKIVYDLEYIKNRSLWIDLKILFKTIAVVFNTDGAR